MEQLDCIEIDTNPNPDAAVIWLHGLGASGEDFVPIVPALRLPPSAGVRFIFPHAPEMPVTINGGMIMPAWYDILEMDVDRKIDQVQLLESAKAVSAIIEREITRGISSNRIIIAGFSQGGAVGYEVALSSPHTLGGLIAMSTYFATADAITVHAANAQIPIHLFHGTADPVVPEALGQKAKALLEAMGCAPGYSTYPVDHTVCLEEIEEITQFLQEWLGF
ncbi:MAG: alpha/beta hydrolase [Gammaproteobacteria bacterium]|nr:alpha/beta hydrolase [Gammaproteobacteria bacterium]